jgi:N-acyl-D-amino-acid deacylase
MTGHTASVFGMVERGVVRAGAYADLVLFDPLTVRDVATFESPALPAEGIVETWVNGHSTYVQGTGATDARGGRLISRNRAS